MTHHFQYHDFNGKKALCISYAAYTAKDGLGVSKDAYYKQLQRGSILEVRCPISRNPWIVFESLSPKNKALAAAKWGDISRLCNSSIIAQALKNNQADLDFINTYRFGNNEELPDARRFDYTEALRYLRLLQETTVAAAKKMGFNTKTEFNEAVLQLILANKIDLPVTYKGLMKKLKKFEKLGPVVVIHKAYGNQVARKVTVEVAKALMSQLTANPHQIDDMFIAQRYNEWAKTSNLPTITGRTVTNYRHDNRLQAIAFGQGTGKFHDKYGHVVRQVRPSAPLLLINSDDNDLDLWFRGENSKGGKSNWVRFTLVVVMDAFNDYILGWAMGEEISNDLVRAAYHSATHHVRELTGGYFTGHQIKTDHWGLKELRPFYEALSTFTPTQLGNARGKVIEQAFGKQWHKMLKLFPNYAGYNITAKNQINREISRAQAKDFPTVAEAPAMVAQFIEMMRHLPKSDGRTGQQQWLEAWKGMDETRKRELPDAKRLRIFGTEHKFTNKITNRGLDVTIAGQKHGFTVPQEEYARYVGMPVQIFYDKYDLNKVLAYAEGGKVQVICEAADYMPMAIADMMPGDRERLNRVLRERKEFGQKVIAKHEEEMALLQSHNIKPEHVLQGGVMEKLQKMQAERMLSEPQLAPASVGPKTILPNEDQEEEINPYDLM